MKKVWILEKFATTEEEIKHYNDFKELLETAKENNNLTEEQISQLNESLANFKKIVDENPDGRWYGFEGKVIYRQFCDVAKAAIRRNPDGKFRVVEAEIEDDAQYWTGYKFVKVNDGVYRYLMATK